MKVCDEAGSMSSAACCFVDAVPCFERSDCITDNFRVMTMSKTEQRC